MEILPESFLSLASRFHLEEGFIWLDSSDPVSSFSSFSLLVWDPVFTLSSYKGNACYDYQGKREVLSSDFLSSFDSFLNQYRSDCESTLPFTGGFVGAFSYDFASRCDDFSFITGNLEYEAVFGFYDRGVVLDHRNQIVYWFSSTLAGREMISFSQVMISDVSVLTSFSATSPQLQSCFESYASMFSSVKNYISSGDIYQANLSLSFLGNYSGDPFLYYLHLRDRSPAPFSLYLSFPFLKICSSSPECLMSSDSNSIFTYPIKGTISRGNTPLEEETLKQELLQSDKDAAELLMIVDLERHDLFPVCIPGSIEVSWFKQVETFSYLHHLVAKIQGRLKPGISLLRALLSLFPGGSIVGAPKIRAAQIISELEEGSRGFYTGSAGFVSCEGKAGFNILIRSVFFLEETFSYRVGSGIVSDSVLEKEFDEMLLKGKGIEDSFLSFIFDS